MSTAIKSGKQILDEFFEGLKGDSQLDEDTTSAIVGLYESGKLTDKNLTNKLSEIREKVENGKNT